MANPTIEAIGPYKIVGQLGEGGMAVVYKALDTRLSRYVAIKMIRQAELERDTTLVRRFEREAKTLAQLNHPNIVKILDYGSYEGQPYLVMEFMSGGTYKAQTAGLGDYRGAARGLLPVARALDYAHRKKVVHRDIKLANILIDENGEPRLSDFGIAKNVGPAGATTVTGAGVAIGTPCYMAPEQFMGGEADLRSDIYSLGVVYFELVTGQLPFQSDTAAAILAKVMTSPVPRPSTLVPGLPPEVDQVLLKAMEKQPQQRYQTMGEFVSALEGLAFGPSPAPQLSTTPYPTAARPAGAQLSAKRRLSPLLLIGLGVPAVLVILTVGVLVLWWLSQTIAPSSPALPPAASQTALAAGAQTPVLTAPPASSAEATLVPTSVSPTAASPTPTQRPPSPTPIPPTVTPTPSDPSLIYSDDFTDRGSGWTYSLPDEFGNKANYGNGNFRIFVNQTQTDLWSNPPLSDRQDVRVSVEAQQASSVANNIFGVICRYTWDLGDANFYFFGISGKGTAAIGKTLASKPDYLARTSEISAAINAGQDVNKITAICSSTTLKLLVNGAEVLSTTDGDLTSGNVGVFAGAFTEPGVDILFENFTVNVP